VRPAGDVRADQAVQGRLAGCVVAVAHDRSVDIAGDDKLEGAWCRPERHLDVGSVEEAEGYIQRPAEASVGVVVDMPSCTTTRTRSWRCGGRLAL
jgi:hypothetical protein